MKYGYVLCWSLCGMGALLVGCEEKRVNFTTTEDARAIARDNAIYNAQKWRATLWADWIIEPRGDSTQSPECPQGDGWASVDLISPDRNPNITKKLKCSTYSGGIGCMEAKDFKERSQYASQEGRCNDEVPFPLPKIGQ